MKSLEFENFNLNEEKDSLSQEQAVDLSTKISLALSDKVQKHNKNNKYKTTLGQLKKVFIHGVRYKVDDKHENVVLGMARVNVFLKVKSGENIISFIKSNLTVKTESLIDLTENIVPLDEDFSSAKEDIEKYSLSNFFSVEELYLDDYKPIEIDWN